MCKVLLVDDEPKVLRALSAALDSDYDIHTSESVSEAQSIISNNGPFDAVISDEIMPGNAGHELLNWCRRNSPKSKRIMLTGVPVTSELKLKISAHEEVSIFPKPWNISDIKDALPAMNVASNQASLKPVIPSRPLDKNAILIVDGSTQGKEVYLQLKRDKLLEPVFFERISELLSVAAHHSDARQLILNLEDDSEQVSRVIETLAHEYANSKILVISSPRAARALKIPRSISKRVGLIVKPFSASRLAASLALKDRRVSR